jgi:hypothetical protein
MKRMTMEVQRMKAFILLMLAILSSGCATLKFCYTGGNPVAQRIFLAKWSAEQQKWGEAYCTIANDLISNTEPERMKYLLDRHPQVISIGMREEYNKSRQELENECNSKNFSNYYYRIRSLDGVMYADETKKAILADSKKVLNECASNPSSDAWLKNLTDIEGIVGPDYFSPYTKSQAAITEKNAEQKKMEETKNRTGIIINVQGSDESHINNGAGSSLGSAIAQANYIDNSNWSNYSASKQLGAGLAGAVIGAILLDKPTTPSFRFTYFVKLFSGEIKQVEVESEKKTYIPEGACVEATDDDVSLANQNNCAGILAKP